jgi:hypothetical protein
MGMSKPWPPKARKLRTAPSGPMCTSAQWGCEQVIVKKRAHTVASGGSGSPPGGKTSGT